MLIMDLSHPARGRYGGIGSGPGGIVSSKEGMFQTEIPGRGGTYPDIPPSEVLGVVTPPEEGAPHILESAP